MKVKIGTKEKMHVITVEEDHLTANMTEEYQQLMMKFLNDTIKNVVIDFSGVREIDQKAANTMIFVQQNYYKEGQSMVFFGFRPDVEKSLAQKGLLEQMNVTPTESEAGDMVQMEEIERELL